MIAIIVAEVGSIQLIKCLYSSNYLANLAFYSSRPAVSSICPRAPLHTPLKAAKSQVPSASISDEDATEYPATKTL